MRPDLFLKIWTTIYQKKSTFFLSNNSVKTESISKLMVYNIQKKFHVRKLWTRPPHLNNFAALPCETLLFAV